MMPVPLLPATGQAQFSYATTIGGGIIITGYTYGLTRIGRSGYFFGDQKSGAFSRVDLGT